MPDATPTDVQMELARKANVCRAVADGITEGDKTDPPTLGRANILRDMADDLEGLASDIGAGGGSDGA